MVPPRVGAGDRCWQRTAQNLKRASTAAPTNQRLKRVGIETRGGRRPYRDRRANERPPNQSRAKSTHATGASDRGVRNPELQPPDSGGGGGGPVPPAPPTD